MSFRKRATIYSAVMIVLFALFFGWMLQACGPLDTKPEPGVDKQVSVFNLEHHNSIAIFPTYEYLGEEKMDSAGAHRKYHVWKDKRTGKYIVILVLHPRNADSFQPGLRWVNPDDALFVDGNTAAYNYMNQSLFNVFQKKNLPLPNCIVLAQEFYLDDGRREAVYKMLIVPDDNCFGFYEKPIQELNRVANMQ